MIHLDQRTTPAVTVELGTACADMELQAIAHMMSILRELSDDGKRRTLDYLCDRYPRIVLRQAEVA